MTRAMPRLLRALTALGAVAMVAAALLTPSGLARAAAPTLEFSTDGVSWSATPLASVFASGFRYVPGDTETATVYVRNVRSIPTSVMAAVADVTVDDTEFGTALSLAATDFATGGFPATSLGAIAECTVVAPRRDLAPGEVFAMRFDLAVATWLSGANGQASTANFRLVIGMADLDSPIASDTCLNAAASIPAFTRGGTIASTGVQEPYAALGFAGFALGAGCMLIVMAARRRRRSRT